MNSVHSLIEIGEIVREQKDFANDVDVFTYVFLAVRIICFKVENRLSYY